MWFKWLHPMETHSGSERPVVWWRQLESTPRTAMPFAHLFPRPPVPPAEGEAIRLVRDLVRVEIPERMEDIVKAYQNQRPSPKWEPVEAWQVVSIGRLDSRECSQWGGDGGQVVEWFDQGDLLAAWPMAANPELDEEPAPRGVARVVAWFKGLIPKPTEKQMELANAEL